MQAINQSCLICFDLQATKQSQSNFGGLHVDCPRCGAYSITDEAAEDWPNYLKRTRELQIACASGWIRDHQSIRITTKDLDALAESTRPTVQERALSVLRLLERKSVLSGERVPFITSESKKELLGISYSIDDSEIHFLGSVVLAEQNLVNDFSTMGLPAYAISPRGYAYLDESRKMHSDSRIGFCAMWFNDEVRTLWSQGIEPAIASAGYLPMRIDRHEHNNRIDDEIMAMIRRSKFIVADFTKQRGGVYFEAGFALGLGLQVIWTCRKDELKEVHFDNRQYNFLTWSDDSLEDLAKRLQNRIEATIGIPKKR